MWPIVRDAMADASPEVRAQVRWIVVFWILMVTVQIWDSRNASGAAGVAEFLSALLAASGMALLGFAHILNLTMRETPMRRVPADEVEAVQRVLLALPALGFTAGVAFGGAVMLMSLRAVLGAPLPLVIVGVVVYGGLMLLAARTVMRTAETLFHHATNHATAAAQARSDAAAAQLAALQARLNPHFLFNALNTVAALVRSSPSAAERVVENLSDVLRSTIERSAATSGTVQEEVDYVSAYLALEQERWQHRLTVVWKVAGEAASRPLPPLLLQPLVENALRHGLGARLEGGRVEITVLALAHTTVLKVEDDGVGFPQKWCDGTGLGNLRQRLQALYGDRASVETDCRTDGATVTVTVPAQS